MHRKVQILLLQRVAVDQSMDDEIIRIKYSVFLNLYKNRVARDG